MRRWVGSGWQTHPPCPYLNSLLALPAALTSRSRGSPRTHPDRVTNRAVPSPSLRPAGPPRRRRHRRRHRQRSTVIDTDTNTRHIRRHQRRRGQGASIQALKPAPMTEDGTTPAPIPRTTRHDTTRHDTTRHDRHDTTRHDTTRHRHRSRSPAAARRRKSM